MTFEVLQSAIQDGRVVPSPDHRQTSPDDWMHYLWDLDRRACWEAKRRLEAEGERVEVWSLQDGEGDLLEVERGARVVDNLGWFLVREPVSVRGV